MEFESSSLYQEVKSILAAGSNPVSYSWRAEIHIGDTTYLPYKVTSVDDVCDYEMNYASEMTVTMEMPGGMYAYDILPNQESIDITLYRTPLLEVGDSADNEETVQSERYTAIVYTKGDKAIEGNSMVQATRQALDLTVIETVRFQLISKSMEQLRMISIGDNYRDTTVEEVIKTVLSNASKDIDVDDSHVVQGIDMVEASNQNQLSHISIDHGTMLRDLPSYIQKRYGVYSAGMGYFFTDNRWYLYPIYDTTRYEDSTRTITVINVPRNKLMEVERTYRIDGDHPVIMATGEVAFRDDSTIGQLNGGSGARFLDANLVMGDFSKTEGNKTVAARAENTSEFTSVKRPNGNNLVMMSPNRITSNPYEVYSALARRNGSIFAFVWENAKPELIMPGTMVKLLYLKDGDLIETYGVVLKKHVYHFLKGQTFTATRYQTNVMLSVFIKRPT